MPRKTRLTSEIVEAIAERVRQGAFPYVAAQSVGIPKSTFYDWMAQGEAGSRPYSELSDKVRTAQAEARKDAETRVFREKPLEWLRLGPGRDGWTEPGKLDVTVQGNPLFPLRIQATKEQASDADLASTLMVLEEIGFIQRTPFTDCFIQQRLGESLDAVPKKGNHEQIAETLQKVIRN
jgi:hypothetical protein